MENDNIVFIGGSLNQPEYIKKMIEIDSQFDASKFKAGAVSIWDWPKFSTAGDR